MPFCQNCGQEYPNGAPQCPKCGMLLMQQPIQPNQMPQQQQVTPNTPQKPKKKTSGCLVAILIVIGLSCLSALSGNHNKNNGQHSSAPNEPTVTTAVSTTVTEPSTTAAETAAPEESSAESQTESTAEEAEPIRIVADEENEYSEEYTLNAGTDMPDTNIVYFLPAGRYKVTNVGDYRNQFNVYSRETHITDEGWEEAADSLPALLLEPGESQEVTIPEDYYIEIHGGAFELVPIR